MLLAESTAEAILWNPVAVISAALIPVAVLCVPVIGTMLLPYILPILVLMTRAILLFVTAALLHLVV